MECSSPSLLLFFPDNLQSENKTAEDKFNGQQTTKTMKRRRDALFHVADEIGAHRKEDGMRRKETR